MQNVPLTQLASGNHGDRELNILYKEQIGPARQWSARGLWAEGPPGAGDGRPEGDRQSTPPAPRAATSPPTLVPEWFPCLCNPLIIPTFLFRSGPGGERAKKCNHLHTKWNDRWVDETVELQALVKWFCAKRTGRCSQSF